MKTCPKCNIVHNKTGTFCSRTCANSRGKRTEEFKEAVSRKLRKNFFNCVICNSPTAGIRKTCSSICLTKYHKANPPPKTPGGYRVGSGRSKSGYYKGIYCGSTYELCWVMYSVDHGVKFTRFDSLLEKNGLKYYPDFLLDDGKTIIETKGYEKQESVDRKTTLAESFGYTVKVLRKDDLQYAFDYVKEKYNTTEYHTLYDEYKPKYSYVCSHCSTEFSRDKKLKTNVVFCSRTCAGKGHKGRVMSL
jgi:DNA-directed RNA polymerase subunit RPC12/RpoP